LTHGLVQAPVADRRTAVQLITAGAKLDRPVATRALLQGAGRPAHDTSADRLTTSCCRSNPTRRPSEVVMGAFSSLCSTMNCAISWMETKGRNVLGPGRMACSMS